MPESDGDAIRAALRYRLDRFRREQLGEEVEPEEQQREATDADRALAAELAIQQAMRRGDFDNLPGAGKPLPGLGDGRHDPDWWLRRKIEREQLRGLGPVAYLLRTEDAALTVKASANQWNWDYEYQVDQPLSFNSAVLDDKDRAAAGKEDKAVYPRLLAVDHEMVVPVNKLTRVLVTATDVIHAFALPAFGVKTDAVPGRINEVWFKPEKEGLYYGQCSELCGKDHAFMPIAIRVVSDEQYNTWLAAAKTDLDGANKTLMAEVDGTNKVAAAGN